MKNKNTSHFELLEIVDGEILLDGKKLENAIEFSIKSIELGSDLAEISITKLVRLSK